MKKTTKCSWILWILTGFNLSVFLTGFMLTRVILKRLTLITRDDINSSEVISDIKVMTEMFGNLFYLFSICGLIFTVCWVLLVRECLTLAPVGKDGDL